MFCINWTKKAVKQWLKLPIADRTRVATEITELEGFPAASNVKVLENHQFAFRLRVGRYRVLFDVRAEIRVIDIQEVKKRDESTY